MDNLWAPWRMDYILGEDEFKGCIFCTDGLEDFDRERLILHIGDKVMVMMNRYPYNNGHLLVAPKRHVAEPGLLDGAETVELWDSVNRCLDVLREEMNPQGFNVGINLGLVAGAGVDQHLHVHIVPRWGGDTNFMTVLDDVRSVPEHIQATYNRLRPLIARAFGES